jgi:hypothetical protein
MGDPVERLISVGLIRLLPFLRVLCAWLTLTACSVVFYESVNYPLPKVLVEAASGRTSSLGGRIVAIVMTLTTIDRIVIGRPHLDHIAPTHNVSFENEPRESLPAGFFISCCLCFDFL